jgi:hypothetical protein
MRIQIPASIILTNGFGSGSDPDPTTYLTSFYIDFKDAKKICQQAHHLQSKKFIFLLKFCVYIFYLQALFTPLTTSMRKGKDPEPDPDPELDTDPYL